MALMLEQHVMECMAIDVRPGQFSDVETFCGGPM